MPDPLEHAEIVLAELEDFFLDRDNGALNYPWLIPTFRR